MTPDRQAKAKRRGKTFIRAWRKHRDLNLEQAVERLELEVGYPYSVAQLSRVERGETGYSQDVLEALATIYRCEPADLIMRDPQGSEGIWSIWDQLQPVQRLQLVEIGQTLKKVG